MNPLAGRARQRQGWRGATVALVVIFTAAHFFVAVSPASAISLASVTAVTFSDLVAGKTNAVYEVSVDPGKAGARNLTITFPAGYQITNGPLGLGALAGSNIGGADVADVAGDAVRRTITVRFQGPTPYWWGNSVYRFRIVRGITNPEIAGSTGQFTISTDAEGEPPFAFPGVDITPRPVTTAAFLGTAPAAGEIGLLVTARASSPDALIASLTTSGCQPALLAIVQRGQWLLYAVGAPAFVNSGFPATVTEMTAFFVRCG